jgi:hypothetical protein
MENGRVVNFDIGGDSLAMRCVDLRRRGSASSHRMGQGDYFVSRDSRVASHLARMLISVRDRAFRNRITRWAMVTLFCEDSLAATSARQKDVAAFLSQFHAALLSPLELPAPSMPSQTPDPPADDERRSD